MRAGELRQRITIQQQDILRGTFGEEIPTWMTLATVWAKVVTTGGTESIDAPQVATATLTHEITIRHRTDVTPLMQVLWGTRTLTIRAVVDDNLKRSLILSCDEVVA
jgi:SPP1 family predicted phage head-tail adaptor